MEIKGKVHCFFEQSGTFKNEFRKLGYEAYDYDIQNNFGETDYTIDLFAEIDNAYEGRASVFDTITPDDLIVSFFPCIYFSNLSQMSIGWYNHNYKNLSTMEKADKILERSQHREEYFRLLVRKFAVCEQRGLRLIFENPWAMQTFLRANFIIPPTLVDNDRSLRGDYFKKTTAYWFWNCTPTHGLSIQKNPHVKRVIDCKPLIGGGMCNQERSMISPDYARNFICDFIIGKEQSFSQPSLFDNLTPDP